MKKILIFSTVLLSSLAIGQVGHIMQGMGSVNMSMGGAATAQPLSLSGAIYWNPATLSDFEGKILNVDAGIFFSSPKLSSSFNGLSGTTEDEKSPSIMPAIAMLWAKPNSNHTFGASIFGVSGFGVEFPEEKNNPLSSTFNPMGNSNVILYPQQAGGFGELSSNYMLMQASVSYAYQINKKLSIGFNPILNFAMLSLNPNPLASPDMTKGYPKSNNASAMGYGAQIGIYYKGPEGLKLGASYKTEQQFSDFSFSNTYMDGTSAQAVDFKMNFPAIYSIGVGYSHKYFDFALDYRRVDYEHTDGFAAKGWTPTASVNGFGWQNISVVSTGIQFNFFNKLPIRFGYTFSENPIQPQLAFFSTPATAIIKDAYQVGLGYQFDKLTLNLMYHTACSNGSTTGALLNPMMVSTSNPYGAIPGSSVSYDMKTSMLQIGAVYKL